MTEHRSSDTLTCTVCDQRTHRRKLQLDAPDLLVPAESLEREPRVRGGDVVKQSNRACGHCVQRWKIASDATNEQLSAQRLPAARPAIVVSNFNWGSSKSDLRWQSLGCTGSAASVQRRQCSSNAMQRRAKRRASFSLDPTRKIRVSSSLAPRQNNRWLCTARSCTERTDSRRLLRRCN